MDNDYMVIQHFDYNFGQIQLRGQASDYELLTASLADGVSTAGNYLFYTGNFNTSGEIDLIAFIFPCDDLQSPVSGNPPQNPTALCNASQSLSLTNNNQFIYATSLDTNEAIPSAIVQYGAAGKEVIGGLASDDQGNIYLMGATDSDLSGNGNSDNEVFISKIDPSGSTLWVVDIPLRNGALIFDAVTDTNYVYACGRTLDALPGFTNAGRWDGILLKIDINTGAIVATNQWGNPGIDGYGSIVLDNQGGLYVAGQGSPANTTGTDDAYLIARHNTSDLSNTWRVIQPTAATGFSASAEAWGGLFFKEGVTDDQDRVVTGGWYMAAGGANGFISVYNDLYSNAPTRSHSITFTSPGSQADWVMDSVIDSQGNIYVAGFTSGNLGGAHQGEGDAYITKYDATLSNPQTVQFGTTKSDMVRKMEIDDQDTIYLIGYTYGNLYGNNQDTSLNSGDVFVHKMDSNLNTLATTQFGTPLEDRAYASLTSNNLYLGGMTEGTIKGNSFGSWDGYAIALNTEDLSISTLSVNELTQETNGLIIHPNPASNLIYIDTAFAKAEQYTIYDLQGRFIVNGRLTSTQQLVDISQLSSGTYIIQLVTQYTTKSLKFVKQ